MKKTIKKAIAALFSIVTLSSIAVIPNASARNYIVGIGDVNYDGQITQADAELVLERYVGCHLARNDRSNGWNTNFFFSDVDGDHELTPVDAQLILMFCKFCRDYNKPNNDLYFNVYLNNYQRYSGVALAVKVEKDIVAGRY